MYNPNYLSPVEAMNSINRGVTVASECKPLRTASFRFPDAMMALRNRFGVEYAVALALTLASHPPGRNFTKAEATVWVRSLRWEREDKDETQPHTRH